MHGNEGPLERSRDRSLLRTWFPLPHARLGPSCLGAPDPGPKARAHACDLGNDRGRDRGVGLEPASRREAQPNERAFAPAGQAILAEINSGAACKELTDL